MTKEKASLSDWVQFLNGKASRGNTYFVGMLSLSFSFFMAVLILFSLALSIPSIQISEHEKINLLNSIFNLLYLFVGGALALIFFGLFFRTHPYFECAKAIKLLDKIMQKEGEIEVDDIRKEWFKKREIKMCIIISIYGWKKIRTVTITIGICILVIGLILMIYGTNFFPITYSQWFASFGLAILALGVAFHSIVISKESSIEITAIANAAFLELVSIFEDKRIQLLQHPEWLGFEGTIWKCWTYTKRAIKLMEYTEIDNENQTELAKQYISLTYHTGVPWEDKIVKKADIENMIKICSSILEFDLDSEDEDELKGIHDYLEKIKKKK